MPSITSITLADNVPTNHVFNPLMSSSGHALLIARETVTSAASRVLELLFSPSTKTRVTNRVQVKLAYPIEVTDSTTGVVSTRCTPRFEGVWILPDSMTTAERLTFDTLVEASVTNTVRRGYVRTLDPFYG